ncbi:MAG: protease SohB [Pseudohongiellaceae bacterium]
MEFLSEYGLFLAKTLTIAVVTVLLVVFIAANATRHRHEARSKGNIVVSKLNDEIEDLKQDLRHEILDEEMLKAEEKAAKKRRKEEAKARKQQPAAEEEEGKRVFVLDFDGDMRASEVEDLRQCITAVLTLAQPDKDEVLLRLESPGGMVHAYGLAASQLVRLRKHGVPLTICVDRVAASGGYMMACVANRLIAAPFAYIGSIGVLVQLPNVHRLLKDNKVDFEMITAGEYKRTLTTFGENTDKDRAKVQEEVDEMHELFKRFILENRPGMDMAAIATGEVWTGLQALERGLIDAVDTSDEWITDKCRDASVYRVSWEQKKPLRDRLSSLFEGSFAAALDKTLWRWVQRGDKERYWS